MTISEAIQKAVEDGYNVGPIEVDMVCDNKHAHYFQNPQFWQALGKAMGWNKLAPYELVNKNIPEWHYHWHKFIDHLAEGGDPTSFFNQL